MPLIPYVITTSRTDLFILFDALLLYRYLKRPTSNYTGLNYFWNPLFADSSQWKPLFLINPFEWSLLSNRFYAAGSYLHRAFPVYTCAKVLPTGISSEDTFVFRGAGNGAPVSIWLRNKSVTESYLSVLPSGSGGRNGARVSSIEKVIPIVLSY